MLGRTPSFNHPWRNRSFLNKPPQKEETEIILTKAVKKGSKSGQENQKDKKIT